MLRRDFGISAHEAEEVIPAWEIRLLLQEHAEAVKRERG